jgi:peptidoglycan/LPS O-acetylase OafA/YrhL
MKQKKYFTELESLRGIAALMVCIFHIRYWAAFRTFPLISHFDLFVDFFFVLSGFVIALNFSNSVKNSVTYKNYLLKRFFRLYPLFLVASIPYFFTSLLKTYYGLNSFQTSNYFKISDFIFYITLTFKWGIVKDLIFNHPAWSISIELLLYFMAGFVFMISKSRIVNIVISLSLSLISIALLIAFAGTLNTTGSFAIFRGVFSFFIGVIIYYFYNVENSKRPKITLFTQNLILTATIALIAVAFWFTSEGLPTTFTFPILWALLIYFIINEMYPSWLINFLKNKYFLYLGTISYSFYLMHPIMIFVTEKILKKSHLENSFAFSIGGVIMYICLTIMVSGFTFKYIEIPGKDLYKRRFKTGSKEVGTIAVN